MTGNDTGAGARAGTRAIVYGLYFLSGATALVFEILWTRRFVVVFGNSTYAVSVVLAAFMAGLGLGGLIFGRIADRRRDSLYIFALIEGGIIIWALLIPGLLSVLSRVTPLIFASVSSFALISLIRFGFSFAVLLVPCLLMGGTLPVLSRFTVQSRAMVGTRVSLLYGLNTLGAAAGCFGAGFFFLESMGQSGTNHLAVGINLFILVSALALRARHGTKRAGEPAAGEPPRADAQLEGARAEDGRPIAAGIRRLLLAAAFVSGFATMCVEVLWVRFLVFVVPNNQYSFTAILGVLLFGLALGSILYRVFLAGRARQLLWLGGIEAVLGPVILISLLAGAGAASNGALQEGLKDAFAGGFLRFKGGALGLSIVTIFLPTVLIGLVFPLVSAVYTRSVATVGRNIGAVFAVNTFGSILGSLAPIAFMVSFFGIEGGIFAVAVLNSLLGFLILSAQREGSRALRLSAAAAALLLAFGLLRQLTDENLTQKIFLSDPDHGGANHEVVLYREGRTATVMVIEEEITGLREVYIGGIEEVPTTYMGHLFFKLFGSIGPLLHEDPDEVLVLCLGGGVTAGTITQFGAVEKVECVDLVAEMVEACRALGEVNNDLVDDPKFQVVVEDARNYLLLGEKKFPVIICDSTHPKSPDSWVLYTAEFYRTLKTRVAENGVIAQWAPIHGISLAEYKTIVRTFQSVFPHTSLWMVAGVDETGTSWATTIMLATPERLVVDVGALAGKLGQPAVKADMEFWDLDTPEGVLSTFLCGEETVREWVGEGPINTDDLPYTQYHTSLTGTKEVRWDDFAWVLESVRPHLRNTGGEAETQRLEAALDRRLSARRLLLEGKIIEAAAEAPESRMSRIKTHLDDGQEYIRKLARRYEGDARALKALALRMQGLVGYDTLAGPEDFAAVTDIYRMAAAADPTDAEIYVNLGVVLLAAGRIEDAGGAFEKALALDAGNFQAHMNIGALFDRMGRLQDAAAHFERALEIDRSRPEAYDSLGTVMGRMGLTARAVGLLEEAVKLAPEAAEYRSDLGAALAQGGDAAAAVNEFSRAVSLDPSQPQYRLSLGMALAQAGRYDEAVEVLSRLVENDAQGTEARFQLGVALLESGRTEEAAAQMRKVLAVDPTVAPAREVLAGILRDRGERKEAVKVLREGMRLCPSGVQAHILARILATAPEAALRDGVEAVSLAESVNRATGAGVPEILDTLAAAYAEAGRFEDAVRAAGDAAELARARGNDALAGEISGRLALYRAGKPYREE